MYESVLDGVRRFNSPFNLKVCVVLFALALVARPFGMDTVARFELHLLFWGLVISSASLMGHVANALGDWMFGEDCALRSDLVMVGLMGVFYTPILYVLIQTLTLNPGEVVGWLTTLGYVLATTGVVAVFRRILPGLTTHSYVRTPEPEQDARLRRRLPADFEGPILRLTVSDHFVNVIGEASECSLRLRFADAVAEMEPVEGYYTHRSHWVSRSAVQEAERQDGRYYLRLVNGDRVPVSRTYRPMLEDAGYVPLERASA